MLNENGSHLPTNLLFCTGKPGLQGTGTGQQRSCCSDATVGPVSPHSQPLGRPATSRLPLVRESGCRNYLKAAGPPAPRFLSRCVSRSLAGPVPDRISGPLCGDQHLGQPAARVRCRARYKARYRVHGLGHRVGGRYRDRPVQGAGLWGVGYRTGSLCCAGTTQYQCRNTWPSSTDDPVRTSWRGRLANTAPVPVPQDTSRTVSSWPPVSRVRTGTRPLGRPLGRLQAIS